GLANAVVAWQLAESLRPVIGASGGVSAIIGVYLGLFPSRRMGLWLPLGLYLQFARVPALLVIGSWFAVQLLFSVFGPISSDVAWWSHVAGFLLGLAAAVLLRLIPGQANLALRED
ncbi:MAG: rhomboid family intramembrane serine protease, partial [Pseudomonadota bacterium]